MYSKPGSPSGSFSIQQIAAAFRRAGWVSVWAQGVLAVVSSVVLTFAALFSPKYVTGNNAPVSNNFSTASGVFFTSLGILILFFSVYWAYRYVVIGRLLVGEVSVRPKKSATIQRLRLGLQASLLGMLLAIIGSEAIVGVLVGKASISQGSGLVNINPAQVVQSLDMFTILASIQVILAHYVGIVVSLFLLNRMHRPHGNSETATD